MCLRHFRAHKLRTPLLCRALLQTLAMRSPGPRGVAGRPGAVGRRRNSPALPCAPALVPSRSVAKSLGAKTVAARALECTQDFEIFSEVVEDAEAVSAVQRFLGE